MGLLDLLEKSKANAPKARSAEDNEPRLRIIDMSRRGYTKQDGTEVPTNRGTIKFIPIVALDGKEIKYAYDVNSYLFGGEEFNTNFRLMDPKDYEMELSDEQKSMIIEGRSLMSHLAELGYGFPDVEIGKNFALIFGHVLEHVSDDGATITDKKSRKTALLVMPSKNVAKALTACLTNLQGYGDEVATEIYNDLFSRNNERENFLTLSFTRPEGSFGYEVSIVSETFDRKCVKILTPEELAAGKVTIPQEEIDWCTSQSAIFFANNRENSDDFDQDLCQKVIDQMKENITNDEKAAQAAESLPKIPSKNGKKKQDIDEE